MNLAPSRWTRGAAFYDRPLDTFATVRRMGGLGVVSGNLAATITLAGLFWLAAIAVFVGCAAGYALILPLAVRLEASARISRAGIQSGAAESHSFAPAG